MKRFLSKEFFLSQEELNSMLRESLEPMPKSGPDLDHAKTARSVVLEEPKTQLKVVFTHSIEKLSHTIYWVIHDSRKSNKREKATWNSVLDEARNLKELFDIAMNSGCIEASYKERIEHRVGVSLFRRWEILTQEGFHKSSEAIELRKIFEEIVPNFWQKGLDNVAEAARRKASVEAGVGLSSPRFIAGVVYVLAVSVEWKEAILVSLAYTS